MFKSALFLASAFLSIHTAFATTYTADIATGSDSNLGTAAQPFKSLSKCVSSLRAAGDICELTRGTYDAGGVISASGTSSNPIVIRARQGDVVVIRQGSVPAWVQSQGNLWSASLAYTDLLASQRANASFYERGIRIWKDSTPLTEACFPNLPENGTGTHPTIETEPGSSNTILVNSTIPVGDLRGARAMAYPYLRQVVENLRVNSSGTGRVNINSGYYNMEVGKPFYLEGSKTLIDQDYEWTWDEPTGKIWIQMPARTNPILSKVRIQTSSIAFTLQAASYVTIQDLRFEGVVPLATSGSVGVRYENLNINEAGILQFGDNTYDYLQLAGLVLRDGAVLTGSTIDGCNGRCVDLAGSGITVKRNVVRNGVRMGQYEGAISVGGRNNRVESNLVENSGRDGIAFTALSVEGAIVRRNWIRNCGLQAFDAGGITVGGHPNGVVTIDSNLIMGVKNGGAGIFFDEATQRNNVDHNVVGGASTGFTAQANLGSKNYTFQNNSIWHNTILSDVASFMAIRGVSSQSGTRYSNNITSVLPTVESIQTTSISSRASTPAEFVGQGATWGGNLEAGTDPSLVNVAARNFGLQAGSRALDIGDVGAWVFNGSKPDAGAVESGTKQWIYGPDGSISSSPVLGFDDASKWNPPVWDNAAFGKELSPDKVEGNYSLAIVANGYKVLESAPMNQSVVGGTNSIAWAIKLSSQQPNPWWIGQMAVNLTCPSRNIYNAWIGQLELTQLPLGQWLNVGLTLPSYVSTALEGAKYSDLSISLVMNVNQGAGPLLLDNFRFLP
jgi:hypothetical protein